MRASYMLHLPALAGNNRISGLASEVGRFGLVLRSVYGDGSKIMGIYINSPTRLHWVFLKKK